MVPVPPDIDEPVEPVVHGVASGMVAPLVMVDVDGGGTVNIGLSPLVPVSVAPSGIVLPITLDFAVDGWVEAAPLPDAVAQLALDVSPPPSNVEEVDDVPPPELVVLQDGLVVGPSPPGLISVAPRGTPVALTPLVPLVSNGDVTPSPC